MEHGQQWEMDLYERAVEVYGEEAQMIKAAEELSELAAVLNKLAISLIWGIGDRSELEEKMRGEWADVSVMLGQLHVIFGDNAEMEMEKLEALEKRLDIREAVEAVKALEHLYEVPEEQVVEEPEEMEDCDE